MPAPDAAPIVVAPAAAQVAPARPDQTPLVRDRQRGRSTSTLTPTIPLAPDYVREGASAPYIAFSQQQYSALRPGATVIPAGSPNTPAIWILALLPLMVIPLQVVGLFTGLTSTTVGSLFLGLAVIVVMVGLVIGDSATLRQRHLPAASPWWVLLIAPLAYFIARRVALKKAGVISNAPGNVYVLSFLGAPALLFVVALGIRAIHGS